MNRSRYSRIRLWLRVLDRWLAPVPRPRRRRVAAREGAGPLERRLWRRVAREALGRRDLAASGSE